MQGPRTNDYTQGISTTTPSNPNLTPSSLHTLRRKLQETQKLHSALVAEKTRNEALIRQLRSLLQPPPKQGFRSSGGSELGEGKEGDEVRKRQEGMLAFLTHTPAAQALGVQALPTSTSTSTSTTTATTTAAAAAAAASTSSAASASPLSTHTQFTISQLPHLRSLLASLRPHLSSSSLQHSQHHQGARADLARERRLYVESQSKRILEKRGVDTIDGVEGGDTGGRGPGGVDEVGALEGLVGKGILSGRKGGVKKQEEGEEEEMNLS